MVLGRVVSIIKEKMLNSLVFLSLFFFTISFNQFSDKLLFFISWKRPQGLVELPVRHLV